ncbi:MAG: AURKAIP1/COX24 domain-containing protein [Desulfobacterales bacterium]
MGTVVKKRRKKIRKHKHRKMLKKTRHKRRKKS